MPQFPRVGDLFGRYRIDAQIGQGGMGVVFSATDTAFERRVALKVVSAALGGSVEFLARFEREASLLARLNSPHVIAIFDYGEQDGCPYLATQYVGGGDLGALLAARGPMPPKLAAEVCAQVADALGDAHRAGVVHRDVKPTNVLLRDADTLDLHAYLCDFGIARTDSEGLTAPGSVSGTWSYLAPECGAGAPGTVASDLYALGCLFWASLTGQPPFRGSDVEIAIAHQNAPVPQLAGDDPFSRHANAILANTLAKDPRARYQSADALRADLLAAATIPTSGLRPVVAAPTMPPGSAAATAYPSGGRLSLGSLPHATPSMAGAPRRRRTALVVALSALAVLAVAGGIVGVTMLGDGPEPGPTGGSTASTEPTPTGSTSTGTTEPPKPEVVGPVTSDLDDDGFGDVYARQLVSQPKKKTSHYRVAEWTSDGGQLVQAYDRRERPRKDTSLQQVLGDFDGDEVLDRLDIVNPNSLAPLTITGEIGDTSLRAKVSRPAGGRYTTTFAGDADGDGLDDLLFLAWSQDPRTTLTVALSDGTGFGPPQRRLDLPYGYPDTNVELGDFDGDGLLDLAAMTTTETPSYDSERSTVRVYLGRRGGTFRQPEARNLQSEIGNNLYAADVDGDEDSELVVTLDRGEFIELLVLDHGPAGMKAPRGWGLFPLGTATFWDSSLVVGDYNGDGRDDVLSVAPAAAKGRAVLQVVTSTGRRFGGATKWGTWDLSLVDSYGVDLLGASYP
jgi:serine/threonine protein kinase